MMPRENREESMPSLKALRAPSPRIRHRAYGPAPKKLRELSGRGIEDLASVAIHEIEAERGGPLAESTEDARTLL